MQLIDYMILQKVYNRMMQAKIHGEFGQTETKLGKVPEMFKPLHAKQQKISISLCLLLKFSEAFAFKFT